MKLTDLCINDTRTQMMYKSTPQTKKKSASAHHEVVERALVLMENVRPASSLIVSPRTRVSEFKTIFSHEYPQLSASEYFEA
jgi:hypothetical protein